MQETWARLIATHNEGGHITALLAQYGDKDALIARIVTAYKAEITKLKDGDFAGDLSGEPKGKIKTEMRLFEDTVFVIRVFEGVQYWNLKKV